eukprot:gene96-134_t
MSNLDEEEISKLKIFIQTITGSDWPTVWRRRQQWFSETMPKYQDKTEHIKILLDEVVPLLVDRMITIISTIKIENNLLPQLDSLKSGQLFAVCKSLRIIAGAVSGDTLTQYFPVEPYQLEYCVCLLRCKDWINFDNWEIRYILLLWLAHFFSTLSELSSLKFSHISLYKNQLENEMESVDVISESLAFCREFLADAGLVKEASSLCLSVLLTRPEIEIQSYLPELMNWTCTFMTSFQSDAASSSARSSLLLLGMLQCVTEILQRGHALTMVPHALAALQPCINLLSDKNATRTRQLSSMLVQQIGVTVLSARSENESDHMPVAIDCIIQQLIYALGDKDTVVRCSAAKGVGRVGSLIAPWSPSYLDIQVTGSLLAMFRDEEDHAAWHGACIGLAEVSRSGLLLPQRLGSVMPLLARAILFDVMRDHNSVGAHVRDAACNTCITLAKSISCVELTPYADELFRSLLLTSLYDREVRCRRIAFGAFTECIALFGSDIFPVSVEVISRVDPRALTGRASSFTQVAPTVGAIHDDLHAWFEQHIRVKALSHWDEDVRSLGAKSLGKLAKYGPDRLLVFLGEITAEIAAAEPVRRHGILLAMGETLLVLRTELNIDIPVNIADNVIRTVPAMVAAKMFRGEAVELIRNAACLLIECIARANLLITINTKTVLVEFLNECLVNANETIQQSAVCALRQIFYMRCQELPPLPMTTSVRTSSTSVSATNNSDVMTREDSLAFVRLTTLQYMDWMKKCDSTSKTRGAVLAVGVVPVSMLIEGSCCCHGDNGSHGGSNNLDQANAIVDLLDSCSRSDATVAGVADAETRRNAVNGLSELGGRLTSMDEERSTAIAEYNTTCEMERIALIRKIFGVLLRTSTDYGIDTRGDVGSWVRTAALRGLVHLLLACHRVSASHNIGSLKEHLSNILSELKFTRFGLHHNSDSNRISSDRRGCEGWLVNTSLGMGVVGDISEDGQIIHVHFPPESPGGVQAKRGHTRVLGGQHDHDDVFISMRSDTVQLLEPPPATAAPAITTLDNHVPVDCGGSSHQLWQGLLTETLSKSVVIVLIKQLAEKLDAVRGEAGLALSRLVRCRDPFIDTLPIRDILESIVEGVEADRGVLGWTCPRAVYPHLLQLLDLPPSTSSSEVNGLDGRDFFSCVLSGLIVSISGLTDAVVKESSAALLKWSGEKAAAGDTEALDRLLRTLLTYINNGTDRVKTPSTRALVLLLGHELLTPLLLTEADGDDSHIGVDLVSSILKEAKRSSDVIKVSLCVDALVLLIGMGGSARRPAFEATIALLNHKKGPARAYAAEQLYLQMLSDPHLIMSEAESLCDRRDNELLLPVPVPASKQMCSRNNSTIKCGLVPNGEAFDKASEILIGTAWTAPSSNTKASYTQLMSLFGE